MSNSFLLDNIQYFQANPVVPIGSAKRYYDSKGNLFTTKASRSMVNPRMKGYFIISSMCSVHTWVDSMFSTTVDTKLIW